ncbi:hypothetical protein A8F94_17445 [Bacillus sp. FJAT-27225]|uniref:phage tail protein n=1 Tax=Bacillus sp. FJAT-27225 TaxID=1743144 RepID=UPI00080C34C3|nr:phage tail protein [Bacillus sp. FJAT-27225]OCA84481.1 hypothetical protein A8F94_17445 [Bacillus sp. FJAT-27225]
MFVRNLTGDEFPVQATITNESELNGNRSLSAVIHANKVNNLFINNLSEMWEISDLDEVVHKIIFARKKGEGNKQTIDIKAIPLFFDILDSNRIYEEYNESMTANQAFDLIFAGTGFNFVLVDSFLAVQWEGFGKGETKLSSFKRALNRYRAEFRLSGNTVYLHTQIGRDTSIMYRHKLNASNIVMEMDASAFWTHAKGFGDYDEGDEKNAKLKREYTSPLAQIPGIGMRHAPPIYDGRVKDASTMDAALKDLVDNSLKISVSADIHDLTKQGYPIAQSELGDRVFLIDERIGLNDEVRVVEQSITRNWRGEILDIALTFGTEPLVKRHQSDLQTAIDRINELIEGRGKLPFNALDDWVIITTKALLSAQTELIFGNGIIGQSKIDPNRLTLLNSEGFGISKDGGNTFVEAITADGFNLSAGAIGQLDANNIRIGAGSTFENGYDPSKIEVGGRNLVPYSKIGETSSAYGFGHRQLTVDLIEGETYTITVNGRVDQQALNDGKWLEIYLWEPTWVKGVKTLSITSTTDTTVSAQWVATWTGRYNITFYLYPSEGSRLGKATVNWVKVEKGNKATDWTPAPEDVEADATAKANAAGQAVREDLRLTAPLPTSLDLGQHGVRASNPDGTRYLQLDYRGGYVKKGAFTVERDDGFITMIDGKLNQAYDIFGSDPPFVIDARVNGRYFQMNDGVWSSICQVYTFERKARYVKLQIFLASETGALVYFFVTPTSNQDVWLASASTNAIVGSPSEHWLTLDLGVPDGSEYAIYCKMQTTDINCFAQSRVVRIKQTDFL